MIACLVVGFLMSSMLRNRLAAATCIAPEPFTGRRCQEEAIEWMRVVGRLL